MLLVLRLITHLDHLAPAVGSTALADVMRAHQLAALRAWHQGWRSEPLVLAAIAAAVARNFGFWYGTHVDEILLMMRLCCVSSAGCRLSRHSSLVFFEQRL